MQSYTYKPDYRSNGTGYFGTVDIIIGSRLMNSRVIRIARKDKESALRDAGKLSRLMAAMGMNCPINLNDYQ